MSRLTALVIGAVLAFAGTASAQAPPRLVSMQRQPVSHHDYDAPKRPVKAVPSVPLPLPSEIGLGNTPGCVHYGENPVPFLRAFNASILRVIVNPGEGETGSALPCVQAAVTAGYHVELTVAETADFYRQMLATYGQCAWAIAVGNEQELNQGGGGDETGVEYAARWQAVEPIVASMAPQSIRVAGEVSPWGLGFMANALKVGLPGVQALSAHPYRSPTGVTAAQFLYLAGAWHLPMWFTEGLLAYGAWNSVADLPLTQMAGATAAYVWMNS